MSGKNGPSSPISNNQLAELPGSLSPARTQQREPSVLSKETVSLLNNLTHRLQLFSLPASA
jgi:hypothetical protein